MRGKRGNEGRRETRADRGKEESTEMIIMKRPSIRKCKIKLRTIVLRQFDMFGWQRVDGKKRERSTAASSRERTTKCRLDYCCV